MRAVKDINNKYFESSKLKDILILGSGGSARGIAFAIQDEMVNSNSNSNKKIYISARNETTAKQLVEELNLQQSNFSEIISLSDLDRIQKKIGLLIHTTPLGMKGQNQTSLRLFFFLIILLSIFSRLFSFFCFYLFNRLSTRDRHINRELLMLKLQWLNFTLFGEKPNDSSCN